MYVQTNYYYVVRDPSHLNVGVSIVPKVISVDAVSCSPDSNFSFKILTSGPSTGYRLLCLHNLRQHILPFILIIRPSAYKFSSAVRICTEPTVVCMSRDRCRVHCYVRRLSFSLSNVLFINSLTHTMDI